MASDVDCNNNGQKRENLRCVPNLAEESILLGFLEQPLSNALDGEFRRLSANIANGLENLHRRVLPEHVSEAEDTEEI